MTVKVKFLSAALIAAAALATPAMARERHVGQLTPSVTDRIINFYLSVEYETPSIFAPENPKLIVHNGGGDAGARCWHRCADGPAIGLRVVRLKSIY